MHYKRCTLAYGLSWILHICIRYSSSALGCLTSTLYPLLSEHYHSPCLGTVSKSSIIDNRFAATGIAGKLGFADTCYILEHVFGSQSAHGWRFNQSAHFRPIISDNLETVPNDIMLLLQDSYLGDDFHLKSQADQVLSQDSSYQGDRGGYHPFSSQAEYSQPIYNSQYWNEAMAGTPSVALPRSRR